MPKLPSGDYPSSYADNPYELTPLALILSEMRRRYREEELDSALSLARIAAPYLHPRIPAAAPPPDLSAMPDADLDAIRPQS